MICEHTWCKCTHGLYTTSPFLLTNKRAIVEQIILNACFRVFYIWTISKKTYFTWRCVRLQLCCSVTRYSYTNISVRIFELYILFILERERGILLFLLCFPTSKRVTQEQCLLHRNKRRLSTMRVCLHRAAKQHDISFHTWACCETYIKAAAYRVPKHILYADSFRNKSYCCGLCHHTKSSTGTQRILMHTRRMRVKK